MLFLQNELRALDCRCYLPSSLLTEWTADASSVTGMPKGEIRSGDRKGRRRWRATCAYSPSSCGEGAGILALRGPTTRMESPALLLEKARSRERHAERKQTKDTEA